MTNIIKQNLRSVVTNALLNEVITRQSRYYYFLGKVVDFTGSDGTPLSTPEYEAKVRTELTLLKAISPSDVALVIPRINWYSGMTVPAYDVRATDAIHTNYCMTDTFNVYKCLVQNGVSTAKPTGTGSEPFTTGDGYKWKFMYNVPLALRNKFLTAEYIPVSNSLQNRFFSNGSIESIVINNPGSGYDQNTTSITVNGDGVGAVLTPVVSGGQIVSVVITQAGYGYTYANIEVESTQIATSAAVITVNLTTGDIVSPQSTVEMLSIKGTVDSVNIIAGGSGYTTASASIVGDGTGAIATVSIQSGIISSINITTPGSGYSYANVVITGDGSLASAYANVSPPLGHGRDAPSELGASSIMFYGNMTSDTLGGVSLSNDYRQFGIIKDPRNFSYSTFVTDPESSKHYSVTGIFDTSDFLPGTAVTSISGTFTVVTITSGSNGNAMTLYTNGIAITAGTVLTKLNTSISFSAITSKAKDLISTSTGSTCYVITGTFVQSNFPSDTVVVNGTNQFRVVSSTSTKMVLLPINNSTLSNGDVLNIFGGVLQITVTSVINPTVDKNTGSILYIDNRSAFNQTVDQTVTFRTVIKV